MTKFFTPQPKHSHKSRSPLSTARLSPYSACESCVTRDREQASALRALSKVGGGGRRRPWRGAAGSERPGTVASSSALASRPTSRPSPQVSLPSATSWFFPPCCFDRDASFCLAASGLDAGEAPGDAAAFALQAGKGNDASNSKARLVPDVSEFVHSRPRALISLFPF